jgi:ABC-type branched-subunit amino acid transport system substrate-binding protein
LAKRLIQDDKVVGLMGAYQSAVTKTVSTVAERFGIPKRAFEDGNVRKQPHPTRLVEKIALQSAGDR